jgi:stage IV sporulation protein FB
MKVSVHYSFWLLAIVFLFSGLFVELLWFLAVLGIHEAGHLIACLAFRQKVKKLDITAVGGFMEVEIKDIGALAEMILYLSGVTMNVLSLFLCRYVGSEYLRPLLYKFNFLVILFNILPIFPLDGYKALEVILAKVVNQPFTEQKALFLVSSIALAGLAYYFIKNKSLAFMVIFVYLFIRNVVHHANNRGIALRKLVFRYQKNHLRWQ